MTTLILPTKNRPTAFNGWLNYMVRFYPNAPKIVIANGSEQHYLNHYRAIVNAFKDKINFEYLEYPEAMPLTDRWIEVLKKVEDEYIIPAADDDFPIMEKLLEGQAFLEQNPDYVLAIGPSIAITIKANQEILVNLSHAEGFEQDSPVDRMKRFSHIQYPTFYSVVRKKHCFQRSKKINPLFITGFGDYLMGIYDCLKGKVKLLDDFSYITTSNHNHSYCRQKDLFHYLFSQGDHVIHIRKKLCQWIQRHAVPNPNQALRLATRLIKENFVFLFGFHHITMEQVLPFERQLIKDLLTEGTATRARHVERMHFVIEVLKQTSTSNDNQFETYRRKNI